MAAHTTHSRRAESKYETRKSTAQGKAQTLARRTARANKAGAVRITRAGRVVRAEGSNNRAGRIVK